jgi:hypothetical protein
LNAIADSFEVRHFFTSSIYLDNHVGIALYNPCVPNL